MQTIKLSKRQLDNLVRYDVPQEVTNTEGVIYYLKTGIKKIDKEELLFKKLYINHDSLTEETEPEKYIYRTNSMSNKLHTISQLNDYQNVMNIEELVVPRHFVTFKNEIIGFTVPEIKDSINLQLLLKDYKINNDIKIDCLKQIGESLKKIDHLRLYDINFYIHDLQEGNILVTNKDNKIKYIDLDSATFSTEHALPSKPLILDKKLLDYPKYKFNKLNIPYPGVEQELYSYNNILLRFLYGDDIYKLSYNEFNEYLAYLSSLGINNNLIESFSFLYSNTPNINPSDYLDDLDTSQIAQASSKVYSIKKERHIV